MEKLGSRLGAPRRKDQRRRAEAPGCTDLLDPPSGAKSLAAARKGWERVTSSSLRVAVHAGPWDTALLPPTWARGGQTPAPGSGKGPQSQRRSAGSAGKELP